MDRSAMILAVVVFLVAAGADVLWAKYTMYAAEQRAHRAALWASLIIPAGAVSVIAYTDNLWYLVPSCLGAYLGTFIAVHRHKPKAPELTLAEELHRIQDLMDEVSGVSDLSRGPVHSTYNPETGQWETKPGAR